MDTKSEKQDILTQDQINRNKKLDYNKNYKLQYDLDEVGLTRFCFTGGPCAGKTTAMASIASDLISLGYKVLLVPEAATLLMKGGAIIDSNQFNQVNGHEF